MSNNGFEKIPDINLRPCPFCGLADHYEPDQIPICLLSEQPTLDGRRAITLIEHGNLDTVLAVLRRLDDCVYI